MCVMPQSSAGILQVVSGDGDFNDDGVISFMRENDVQDAGVDYQVIAITGPQSSGKSTLMNALVHPHAASDCFSERYAAATERPVSSTLKSTFLAAQRLQVEAGDCCLVTSYCLELRLVALQLNVGVELLP